MHTECGHGYDQNYHDPYRGSDGRAHHDVQHTGNDSAQAQAYRRYLEARNFIYGRIIAMLESRQFQDISFQTKHAVHAPWYDFFNNPQADIEAALAEWAAMVAPNQPWDFKSKVWALLSRYAPIKGETLSIPDLISLPMLSYPSTFGLISRTGMSEWRPDSARKACNSALR